MIQLYIHTLSRKTVLNMIDAHLASQNIIQLVLPESTSNLQWAFFASVEKTDFSILYINLADELERGKSYNIFKHNDRWILCYPPSSV